MFVREVRVFQNRFVGAPMIPFRFAADDGGGLTLIESLSGGTGTRLSFEGERA